MMQDFKTSSGWKIHSTKKINFMPSTGHSDKCLMHKKNKNIENMVRNETSEVIELFHAPL